MSFSRVPLVEKFIVETTGLIEQLELVVNKIEKQKYFDFESIEEIYNIMDKIKSSSTMMLFGSISTAADSIKQLFLFIKENRDINFNYISIIDLILDVSDYMKCEITKISKDHEPIGNSQEYINKVHKLLYELKHNSFIEDKDTSLEYCYKTVLYFKADCEMEDLRAFSIIQSLKELGAYISDSYPEVYENENICNIIQKEGLTIQFQTKLSYDTVYKFLKNTAFIESIQLEVIV